MPCDSKPTGPRLFTSGGERSDPPASSRGPILVVEHDEALRAAIGAVLLEDYAVLVAADVGSALQFSDGRRPALLLLDGPPPPGIAPDIPVIVIASDVHHAGGQPLPGVVGYLPRPPDTDELLRLVRRCLSA